MRSTALALAAILTAACSSPAAGPADAAVTLDAGPDAGLQPPDSEAGAALGFVLAALNGHAVTTADVDVHFTAAFLAQVPDTVVVSVLAQLAAQKPWTLIGWGGTPAPSALIAIVTRGDGQYWRITVAMDAQEASLMSGLTLGIAPDLDPALHDWAAIDAAIAAIAPEAGELAATVDAGGCTPLHAIAADQPRALGSQFKLWVLAALAASVDSGTHAWADPIAIQDLYKSLPSGSYQDLPAGTTRTAAQYAEQMISVSDNTAADHLIWFVGRAQVEAELAAAGHHDPAEDQPFLTTRELFDLKLLLTEPQRQAYIADSIADKRTALASYDATLDPRTFAGSWVTPIDVDQLEWFATPTDVCNVMRTLETYGDKPGTAEVYQALALNPGIQDSAHLFSYVGYKGGSEPGVLTLGWLLQRTSDSGWRFYEVAWANPVAPIDEDRAVYVAGAARAMLAR